jgi:Uri superfamily endonuclease
MDGEDPALMARIIGLQGPDVVRVGADPAAIPDGKGAYLLLLRLDRPVDVPRRNARWHVEPGFYGYAGSACGPGGLKARVARHLASTKRLHWHIDHLTVGAASISALISPGAFECALVERLLASGVFDLPHPGFGSSDCRRCRSHLLRLTGCSPDAPSVGP